MPLYNNGLFIFTRDLRIQDNNGLSCALSSCRHVYTSFFFTPEQVSDRLNKYKSSNAVQFMIESLISLQKSIKSTHNGKLLTLYGAPDDCLKNLITRIDLDAIFINKDVTKYAKTRFDKLKTVCTAYKIPLVEIDDFYLSVPGSVANSSGGIYQKFTPFYNKITSLIKTRKLVIPRPEKSSTSAIKKHLSKTTAQIPHEVKLKDMMAKYGTGGTNRRCLVGGRENALKQLNAVSFRVPDYEATRNNLTDRTTQLSPYIKFGCVSIREVYYVFRDKLDREASASLIRQLFWRDFYAQLMNDNPNILFGPMRKQYANIRWSSSQKNLDAWKRGETGFPIIDAGMRELLHTGYMHNRARLICASFLPKTLLINWRKGEEHFAQNLNDYDPASNNGNWQWVAGTGSDSQPYFRVLNPFLQSKKYDPNAEYIKKWVPELKDVPAEDIHKWDTAHTNSQYSSIDYPAPIVDYASQKEKALKMYKSV